MVLVRKKKSTFWFKVGELFFSSSVFPLVLAFAVFGILFVLFRMNSVEIDYKIASLNKDIEKTVLENKELKAKKARLLSIGKLRNFAKKYELEQPKQKQIIIVP